ncbi:hypothetical protein CDD81_2304 [Ophiocordyceps australis]|uniref:Uncharacterized protein n=1 Tax=Ophiocordyceps australis TaxID=1399860 RepID=A0A2C5YEW6_9HYPO|nr:hypothetical protein CDD81_2304 [Ophiocordyceps australis]
MTAQLPTHDKPFQGITLDTLASQLGQWSPDDTDQLYAIVDMGSNGIRFSITSLAPPNTRLLTPIFSTRAAKSLYSALEKLPDGKQVFPSETIDSVATIIKRFVSIADKYNVPRSNFLILGTAASRDASNAGSLLSAISEATSNQAKVHILDPAVETLFGAVMGSRSCLTKVKGALFLDLGGGSVQMTWVDTSLPNYEISAARYGQSLPFGAAKVIGVLDKANDNERHAEISNINAGVRNVFLALCSKFPKLQAAHKEGKDAPIDLYMCGGGFRGYGSMLKHMDPISPYPISSINTYSVPGSFFRKTKEMREENERYEGKIFGLSKSRRQQFPAILAVVEALIAAVPHIGRVTFCGGSNRQGILMMKLPRDVRESNPLHMLAQVTLDEQPLFEALIRLFESALPDKLDAEMPTIFNLGLGPLFVREIWSNMGYSSDINSSFALNSATTRNPECPGLTHLARAILGLAVCARWEASLSPADARLYKGLCGIADSHCKHASFWALCSGVMANIIALIFPVMPQPAELNKAISFHATLDTSHKNDKEKITLTVNVDAEYLVGIDDKTLDKLTHSLQSLLNKKDDHQSCKVTICKKSF